MTKVETIDDLLGMKMKDIEKWVIEQMLKITGGNRQDASQALGIPERTFYRKLKVYGLNRV